MARNKYYQLAGFCDRLQQAIEFNDYTYKYISYAICVDRKTVYAWLSGASQPCAYHIAKLCKLLKISADWLLFGEER